MKWEFGVIGGDRRQAELARLLQEDGRSACTYGLERWKPVAPVTLEQAASAETVLLPLPLCKDSGVLNCEEGPVLTKDLFQSMRPGQRVLAGQVKPQQRREAEACGILLEDYFLREELAVANAAVTAEVAVRVAMEHMDRAILGQQCLVLGFGRIGRLLCHRLHGLGAGVTATARKPEDLAWIRAYGWRALETGKLEGTLPPFGVVFNTIPAPVLQEPLLAQLSKECLCVDLASQQGIDLAAAERLGLRTVWARSLPGRFAPRTAAAVIRDTVNYILSEGDPL